MRQKTTQDRKLEKQATVAGKTAEQLKEELQAQIIKEKKDRENACTQKIKELLNEFNCEMLPVLTIIPGRDPEGAVRIVAK